MTDDYSKIAQDIISLLEQVPRKRHREINSVLIQKLNLMLINANEKTMAVQIQDISGSIRNFTFKELQQLTIVLKGEIERRKI